MKQKKVLVLMNAISNSNSKGLSGGDRILIELFKRWKKKFTQIDIFTCQIGKQVVNRYLKSEEQFGFKLINIPKKYFKNLFFLYGYRLLKGINSVSSLANDYDVVYSSSDFWPDSLPAFFMKLKNPKLTWIAGYYLSAPSPFTKDNPYKGKFFYRGLLYWLTQLPVFYIIRVFADYVFVTSKPDVNKFVTSKREISKVIVVQGGVDTTEARKYLAQVKKDPLKNMAVKKYAACFVGRFHYQKGVLELIDIWEKVCQEKPTAKLAMIGVGPLKEEIEKKIKKAKLNKNIYLLGFKDGETKYQIFRQSKLILHPAIYDSGGMAAAEGMAWGLPGVSFDLLALKTYYPKGMVKIPTGDLDNFAQAVVRLLTDERFYADTSKEAIGLIRQVWDWDIRAKRIFQQVFK